MLFEWSDTCLHIGMEYLTAGAQTPLSGIDVGDEWSALGHPIADGDGEAYTLEEGSYLGVERCTTDDHLTEGTSQPFGKLLTDLAVYDLTDTGDGEHEAYLTALEDGL